MSLLTLCLVCFSASVVIFIFAMIVGQSRMRQIRASMRQLADQHGASFTPGNLIYNPCITFHDQGLELRLYAALGGRDDPSHTELRATLPGGELPSSPPSSLDPEAKLHLRPHSFFTRLTVTLGAKPYLTGEKAFDDAFDVRGTPEALLRRTLTPQLRSSLLALKVDRPALYLGRRRGLLPVRSPAGEPFRLRWAPAAMQYYFYTAGLPAELEAWEPRLAAGRLLINNILNRPAPVEVAEAAEG